MKWKPCVLIVDDDPVFSKSLQLLLKGEEYELQTASNGREALDRLNRREFDLVLLDVVMPDLNGLEVLDRIRERSIHSRVIMLTGFASMESALESLRRGAFDYLKKPFEEEELIRRVKNALEQRKLEWEKEIIRNRLSVTEDRFQYLVTNSPDIIYTLDPDGRFTFLSGSFAEILGYRPEEMIGKHFSSMVSPADLARVEHAFNERRTASRGPAGLEVRLRPNSFHQDPNGIIVELRAKGLYDRDVQDPAKLFLGTYGVARDITIRKRTEEELKLQKNYFQQLFENSPEGITILDPQDRVLQVNKGFEQMFQYRDEEIRNLRLNDLIVPESLKQEAENISQIIQSLGTVQKDTVRRRKDGSLLDVKVMRYPILHENRQIGSYGIYCDITQHKRWESQLQKTLEKLRRAMGATIHAMASTVEARDPYTAGHQQRVADLARAIAQELELAPETIDGIRMAGAIHDLGKINVPAEILSKPGRLSDIEFSLIKTHPRVAFEILKEIEFPWAVANIVYQHHERIDGSGYPLGLKGDEILLEAKILTVADVVEAIASHRPYRPSLGIRKALTEIDSKRGVYYDSAVIDACRSLFYKKHFRLEGS